MAEAPYTPADDPGTQTSAPIAAHLASVLASRAFARAPVLRRLLAYLVEKTLSGEPGDLKEYAVGVAVFQRGPAFDPSTDTIVRAQARRLRARLAEYYDCADRMDGVRILLPKGHYALQFQFEDQIAPREPYAPRAAGHEAGHWLPVPHTRLIGREQAISSVTKLLLSESGRLLTLTGAGGSGKTRLAIAVAANSSVHFPGGVFFAGLAPVGRAETVVFALAHALGFRHNERHSLLDALRDHVHFTLRAPALLLVDNFEHLLAAGPVLLQLLESSRFLRIVVTSRAVLRVYGEREYPVPPLPRLDPARLPPLNELSRNPAIQLFIERAVAVDPAFSLTAHNAPALAQICSRLDGLPLAIELAAARVRTMSAAAILARIESSLVLLTAGPEGVPERQQTLRNTIDWSHRLLSAPERKLFRRLSVFAGGCTAEGAEAVCNSEGDLRINVLEGLSSLRDRSLLQSVHLPDREPRFVMLETIREFAGEWLAASGEEPALRRAHVAYCLVLAEEGNVAQSGEARDNWLVTCEQEHANLRVAFHGIVAAGNAEWALRMANALFWFWEVREYLEEGRECLRAALRLHHGAPPSPALAAGFHRAGTLTRLNPEESMEDFERALAMFRALGDERGAAIQMDSLGATNLNSGHFTVARDWFEQCLAAYRKLGMQVETAGALSNLAQAESAVGDFSRARALLHESMLLFAACGQAVSVGWSLNHLGDNSVDSGNLPEAKTHYLEALALFRRYQDSGGAGRTLLDLGCLAIDQGDHKEALALLREAASSFAAVRHLRCIRKVIEAFGCLAAAEGRFERALTLAAAATGLRRFNGFPERSRERDALERRLRPAHEGSDAASAAQSWQSGSAMSLEDALAFALERSEGHSGPATAIESSPDAAGGEPPTPG